MTVSNQHGHQPLITGWLVLQYDILLIPPFTPTPTTWQRRMGSLLYWNWCFNYFSPLCLYRERQGRLTKTFPLCMEHVLTAEMVRFNREAILLEFLPWSSRISFENNAHHILCSRSECLEQSSINGNIVGANTQQEHVL